MILSEPFRIQQEPIRTSLKSIGA